MLIDKHKPHVISLAEANYNIMEGHSIVDYNVEYNDFGIGHNISRMVTLIHKSIRYTRRKDLEVNYISHIICDISLSNKGKFTLVSWYRQWNLPKQVSLVAGEYNCQVVCCSKFLSLGQS